MTLVSQNNLEDCLNNSITSLYQDFTKVTKEVAERFVLNFKSQPISI